MATFQTTSSLYQTQRIKQTLDTSISELLIDNANSYDYLPTASMNFVTPVSNSVYYKNEPLPIITKYDGADLLNSGNIQIQISGSWIDLKSYQNSFTQSIATSIDNWFVPEFVDSGSYKIRISSSYNDTEDIIGVESIQAFQIDKRYIKLLFTASSVVYGNITSSFIIPWNDAGISNTYTIDIVSSSIYKIPTLSEIDTNSPQLAVDTSYVFVNTYRMDNLTNDQLSINRNLAGTLGKEYYPGHYKLAIITPIYKNIISSTAITASADGNKSYTWDANGINEKIKTIQFIVYDSIKYGTQNSQVFVSSDDVEVKIPYIFDIDNTFENTKPAFLGISTGSLRAYNPSIEFVSADWIQI